MAKYYFCFALIILISCKGVYRGKIIERDPNFVTANYAFDIPQNHLVQFSMYYFGCSGYLIKKGNDVILIDPFFSNPGPLVSTYNKKINPDSHAINTYFDRGLKSLKVEKEQISTIIITHGHYDHNLDIPYLLDYKLKRNGLKIICGNETKNYIRNHVLDTTGLNFLCINEPYTTGEISIIPIQSDHAPHFKKIGIPIYLFNKKCRHEKETKLKDLKERETYDLLIEFKEQNQKTFRLYYSGAAYTLKENRFDPALDFKNKPVDLAILCAASHKYVKKYPEELIHKLGVKYIIVSHWDNFFQPLSELDDKPMTVPFTNVPKFLKKLDSLHVEWKVPKQGARIEVF